MRSFTCGLENFMVLAHDFVLRRNIRIAIRNSRDAGDAQTSFVASTFGSHHLRLVDHVAKLWNKLNKISTEKEPQRNDVGEMPTMRIVKSGERFGLTGSEDIEVSLSMKHEVKQKITDLPSDATDFYEGLSTEEILASMDINPSLLLVLAGQSPMQPMGGSNRSVASIHLVSPSKAELIVSHP